MSDLEIQTLLNSILESSESESLISSLLSHIPNITLEQLTLILRTVKKILFSKSLKSTTKLQAFRILKSLMQIKLSPVVGFTNKKIVSKLSEIIFFQNNCAGFELWFEVLQTKDNFNFKLLILVLQSIENWSENFGNDLKGKNTFFFDAYFHLKIKNIEFPPSFFLQPYQILEKIHLKRDLNRVLKLNKEYIKNIQGLNKEKSVLIRKIVNSYGKSLSYDVENRKNNGKKINENVLSVLLELNESKKMFNQWKNNNFSEMHNFYSKLPLLVDDPVPKIEPNEENPREFDSFNLGNEEFFSSPSKSANSSGILELKEEICILKDKILDVQGTCDMYKNDLNRLQCNYLKNIEEKDNLLFKLNAVNMFNHDLERLAHDKTVYIEELLKEKLKIEENYQKKREKLKKVKAKSQDRKILIETTQKEMKKMKIYIENLENTNILLLSSNQTLKFELEKSKTQEEALNFNLKSLNPLKIDHPPVFPSEHCKKSLLNSDSSSPELEKNFSFDEEDKNTPNESIISNKMSSLSSPTLSNSQFLEKFELKKPKKVGKIITIIPICDNIENFLDVIRKSEGIFHEDEICKLGIKIVGESNECWGKIYLVNKTVKQVELGLEILSFSENFPIFITPYGKMNVLSKEIIFFSVTGKVIGPFHQSPLLKLTYFDSNHVFILKMPITYPLFFNSTQNMLDLPQNCEEFQELDEIPFKKIEYLGENFERKSKKLEKQLQMHGKFIFETSIETKTLTMRSGCDSGPIFVKLDFSKGKLNYMIKCSDLKTTAIVLEILKFQFLSFFNQKNCN